MIAARIDRTTTSASDELSASAAQSVARPETVRNSGVVRRFHAELRPAGTVRSRRRVGMWLSE